MADKISKGKQIQRRDGLNIQVGLPKTPPPKSVFPKSSDGSGPKPMPPAPGKSGGK